jgi:hypothetical protein
MGSPARAVAAMERERSTSREAKRRFMAMFSLNGVAVHPWDDPQLRMVSR